MFNCSERRLIYSSDFMSVVQLLFNIQLRKKLIILLYYFLYGNCYSLALSGDKTKSMEIKVEIQTLPRIVYKVHW